jgi:hypothetical protein
VATKFFWIHEFYNAARIGIMARPPGEDWLEDELIHLKNNKVSVLVSLLEKQEIYELQLEKEGDFCKTLNIYFINFPIPDRDIPKQSSDTEKFISTLIEKIEDRHR